MPRHLRSYSGRQYNWNYVDAKPRGIPKMALWDEAADKSEELKKAQQEQDEREDREAEEERQLAHAQLQAVAEFIEAMKRLRIKPAKLHLNARGRGRDFRATRGWDIDSPRKTGPKPHYFVTTKGQVHSFLKKKPEDLTEVVRDPSYDGGGYYYLTERLRDGLARAMNET
ncbi:MAG: hypothetical protein ACM4D3_19340 [Candidatus Sericytochromatia bacterium]